MLNNPHRAVLHDAASSQWLHFANPWRIIQADSEDQVLPALQEVEASVNQNGWYAVGFISYEASPAFDGVLAVRQEGNFPLLWFGLYSEPLRSTSLPPGDGDYKLGEWIPSITRDTYNAAINQVKAYIENGKTYQVNYTFRLNNNFKGSAWSLFIDMVRAQAPGFSTYLETGSHIICSASPELFFRLDGENIACRPMKGTLKRGRTLSEDKEMSAWLRNSYKNRAENVMIVDMIRNDLGRLAETGSVQVPELFITERYATLWQMTSVVTAKIRAPFTELVGSLFPCASITGAPKVSTMKIIAALETTPRRLYTGALGYLAPGRVAQFSVAIRTVLIDAKSGQAEYGVGGGIVWDSTSKDEYAEALLKARILTNRQPEFSLLETLRWTPQEHFWLIEEHLRRLEDSAAYFGIPFNRKITEQYLVEATHDLPASPQRLRLLLDREGALSHQAQPLGDVNSLDGPPLRVKLALEPVHSDDVFLFHKTTLRRIYDMARQDQPGCDDVLLFNERSQLTESTIANLVIELDGKLVTPPLECGLLAGTFRAYLLEHGFLEQRVVSLADLARCSQIFLVNSVRGWQKAKLLTDK
jgi:para-aminobenzoate synthetase/4-amino-4-deoxychorismate lyase